MMVSVRLIAAAVSAVVVLLLATAATTTTVQASGVDNTDFPIERLDALLDRVENAGAALLRFTHKHRKAIQGVVGALVFAYGANFPATLLMYQAMGATGLPGLQQNLNDLLSTYKNTRNTFKQEMPQIVKARQALDDALALKSDLEQRLREAKKDLHEKRISRREFNAIAAEIEGELAVVKKKAKQLSQISSSFKRIYSSLNPDNLKVGWHCWLL